MSMIKHLIKTLRMAVVPEYEGGWTATVYHEEAEPQATAYADTLEEAVRKAAAIYEAQGS